MIDLVIRGGDVVDGTGSVRRRADVGVDGGRIVAVGKIEESARKTVDAQGCVVTPGFVDVHTHLDVQGFWDSTLSPAPLHGVTTVVAGNCGFSVAPLDGESAEYLLPMLARVEGMPISALREGVPWNWRSTAEYMSLLENKLAINAGFMVGHSAVRRVVMGDESREREAEAHELEAMAGLVRDGLAAGALGFSSSWGFAHHDGDGIPVPSSHASSDEMVRLAAVCGEFDGTSIEFIPPNARVPFDDRVMDVMVRMSAAAKRPLNWNLMNPTADSREIDDHNLTAYRSAKEAGGHVVALVNPFPSMLRVSFYSGFLLDTLNGWSSFIALPHAQRLEVLKDPVQRRKLEESAAKPSDSFGLLARDWGGHYIFDTHSDATARYQGRFVADVAAEMGKSPFDALVDIVCADELRTGFGRATPEVTPENLAAGVRIWREPGALVGGSDTGAHLDQLATFSLSTTFLARAVREFGAFTTEEAVHHLTGRPAALYGLADRGVLREGAHADIIVFDEATIGPSPITTRYDLPGGAGRLYADATGIAAVLVNGAVIAENGAFTEARPGHILRSGTDTHTPTVAGT